MTSTPLIIHFRALFYLCGSIYAPTPFESAKLDGTSFQRSFLRGISFKKATLVAVNFRGAKLDGIELSETVLHYAKFDEAREEVERFIDGKIEKELTTFLTEIKNTNWYEADATAITVSKRTLSMLPKYVIDSYGETIVIDSPESNTIIRSIEFPRGYEQAGLAILNYFSKVVREKYKDIHVKVSIKQDDQRITMVIETPEGAKEIIEETLCNYELVVRGKLKPESFLEDKLQVYSGPHCPDNFLPSLR